MQTYKIAQHMGQSRRTVRAEGAIHAATVYAEAAGYGSLAEMARQFGVPLNEMVVGLIGRDRVAAESAETAAAQP